MFIIMEVSLRFSIWGVFFLLISYTLFPLIPFFTYVSSAVHCLGPSFHLYCYSLCFYSPHDGLFVFVWDEFICNCGFLSFFLSFSFYHGYEGYGLNERWLVYSGSFYFPCVSIKKECMVVS